jgi:hypothetical protein
VSEFDALSDERWNEQDQCREYVMTDMQLRIATKGLMLQQQSEEWKSPRKMAEIERAIGHHVFELAYRTHTVQDYIDLHRQATLLPEVA